MRMWGLHIGRTNIIEGPLMKNVAFRRGEGEGGLRNHILPGMGEG